MNLGKMVAAKSKMICGSENLTLNKMSIIWTIANDRRFFDTFISFQFGLHVKVTNRSDLRIVSRIRRRLFLKWIFIPVRVTGKCDE